MLTIETHITIYGISRYPHPVSYTHLGALSNATEKAGALMISPLAVALLEQTSLMERGVYVCSDRFLNPLSLIHI